MHTVTVTVNTSPSPCQIKPSNYMKASVQFPPYKAQMVNMNYDQWREAASPSPRPEDGGGGGVRTMVEHFSGEEERRAGTRTVTRL